MTQETRRAPGKGLDFGAFGLSGIRPIGVKALLDNAHLDNENAWQRNKEYFRHGVLVPRAALTTDTIERRIDQLACVYPVNGHVRLMGVAVHEKRLANKNVYLFRGDYIIGDCESAARFWARLYLGECSITGWNVRYEAMCWTGVTPGCVCVPYLDFDEAGPTGHFTHIWDNRVAPTIKLINAALVRCGAPATMRTPVFFNSRPGDTEFLVKYSFHVHWPSIGVKCASTWKSFLLSLDDLPSKLSWTKSPDGTITSAPVVPYTPIFDTAVYGGKQQLFRGPFCGKRGDAAAVMMPLVVQRGLDGQYSFPEQKLDEDAIVKHLLDARTCAFPSEVLVLELSANVESRRDDRRHPDAVAIINPVGHCVPDSNVQKVIEFVMPFFERVILPAWQQHRYAMLTTSGGVEGAVVPTTSLVITRQRAVSATPGRVYYSVQGDSFCECDSRHVHASSPGRIGLCVDFLRATISQTCHACDRGIRFPVYSFLHTGNRVRIELKARSGHSSVSCWSKSPSPHQVILDYFHSRFVLQRVTRILWAYDSESRVWRADESGNMVVGKMIDELNRKHDEYINAQRRCFMDMEIHRYDNPDEEAGEDGDESEDEAPTQRPPRNRAEAIKRIETRARKFVKENTPIVTFTPSARGKILDELRNYAIHTEVAEMNPFASLIPMNSGQYIDVLTGNTGEMEAKHYFTAVVSARFNLEDTDIPTVEAWFDEVSTGDKDKCQYLKLVSGYCFTFMMHDRKYFILVGSGKNGKGMLKEFIMNITTGPPGYDSRHKNMSQQFWSARANASSGPEAPSPEAFEMRNKTFLYTDDITPIAIDSNKIKRVIAGEPQSARGLYSKSIDIRPRGKVMHTSNFDPSGPGEDQAYWDRTVVVKMLTKYVDDPSKVDPGRFRFVRDQARYLRLVAMKDAFFTVTVRELIRYYKTLPHDTHGDVCMGPFPIPDSVQKATTDAKEKKLPLAAFMSTTTKSTDHPLYYAKLDDLFKNYLLFLHNSNETRIARDTTIGKFEELLAMALDIHTIATPTGLVVEGRRLTSPITETQRENRYTGFVDSADRPNQHENYN